MRASHLRALVLLVGLLAAGPLLAAGLQRTFDLGEGGQLVVDAEGSKVIVETGGRGASVDITRRNDSEDDILDDYRIDLSQDGDRLQIEVEKKHRWQIWDWHRGLSIRVRVPRRFDVDVTTSGGSVEIAEIDGAVDVRTSGGSVELTGSNGSARVHTSGGSIRLGDVGGEVDAVTSGGSIHIDHAGGAVVAKTSGGSIRVDEVMGPIDARTSGGSVRAYISRAPDADSSLRTSGGSVVVYLDENVGVDLDARATGGRVASDFEVRTASGYGHGVLEGPINGGGAELVLRTAGGGIRVLRK